MKWLVIGGDFNELRYQVLSDFLKEEGYENTLDFLRPETENFLEALEESKKNYDQIRIERPFGEKIVAQLPQVVSLAKSLGAADAYVQVEGKWWPENTLCEGMVSLTAKQLKGLDLTASVFVVGTGSAARSSIAAYAKLGFKKINITDRYTEKLQKFVQDMRRVFFGLNLQYTSLEKLTMLPGNHQVVINTTPLVESNTLLEELYYFNYMHKEGIAIDMTLVPVETPFISEAKAVNATTVSGYEIAAWSDTVWLEKTLNISIETRKYAQKLHEKLSQVEFDLSPFTQKRQE